MHSSLMQCDVVFVNLAVMTGHFALAKVSSAGPVVLLLLSLLLNTCSGVAAVVLPVCTHQ